MFFLLQGPSASFTLPNPKNWMLLKHCQGTIRLPKEGGVQGFCKCLWQSQKLPCKAKGMRAGIQRPSHGAAHTTPGHWSSHKQLKPALHLFTGFYFLSWFDKPWLHPCGCSEWKTEAERKEFVREFMSCSFFHLQWYLLNNSTCHSSENGDWPLSWRKETSFSPPSLTVYVFSYILMKEEMFSANSTTQTLESWVPLATFNKSLLPAPPLMKMHLRSIRAN